ncbi:MAG: hypothetical protein N2738_08350, partial [Thermodesulfovibrionales bacterium]|nr:hypothetical protein [Thermodesulfovibrionales bacterium]
MGEILGVNNINGLCEILGQKIAKKDQSKQKSGRSSQKASGSLENIGSQRGALEMTFRTGGVTTIYTLS